MGQPTATIKVGPDGIAIITLQNPPVNALHPAGVFALRSKILRRTNKTPAILDSACCDAVSSCCLEKCLFDALELLFLPPSAAEHAELIEGIIYNTTTWRFFVPSALSLHPCSTRESKSEQ